MSDNLLDRLGEFLEESDIDINFDSFRDITKGCHSMCIGMNPSQGTEYCRSHTKGIMDGDYLIKGGRLEDSIKSLQQELAETKERLREAGEVVDFYGEYHHWLATLRVGGFGEYDAIEYIDLEPHPKKKNRSIGGKRARAYQDKWKGE